MRATQNPFEAIARKLKQRIQELEQYQPRHPEAAAAQPPLEVFCDLNPSNINCRVYDDCAVPKWGQS